VGRLFESFEEAWDAFLVREEPLEDFFGRFADEEGHLTVWLAPPGPAAVAEATAVQAALEGTSGLVATPSHWLHVALGVGSLDDADTVRERLDAFGAFDAAYGPMTCFHEALVLEARSPRFAELARAVDPGTGRTFLPHLSVAYVDGSSETAAIRERVVALRDRAPVVDRVTHVDLCVIPVPRPELLAPWRVVARVAL